MFELQLQPERGDSNGRLLPSGCEQDTTTVFGWKTNPIVIT